MCRFYATEIFWTSSIRHFDYYSESFGFCLLRASIYLCK